MRASLLKTMRRVADEYRRFNQARADEAVPRIAELARPPIRQGIRAGGWRRTPKPDEGDRSLSVARAIHLHLPDGYKLWVRAVTLTISVARP